MHISRHQVTLATLFCSLLVAGEQSFAGKLFEWVDKNGAAHYSDCAPVGRPFAEITVRPASGTGQPGNETGIRRAERALLKKTRHKDTEIKRTRQAAAQQIEQGKSRCRQARSRYHDAIHQPGSAGDSDFRALRRKMKDACD